MLTRLKLPVVVALAAAALLPSSLTACGSGSKTSGSTNPQAATTSASATSTGAEAPGSSEVVIHVGPSAITRGEVSHWMGVIAAGDYHELSAGHTLPTDLVSDPPSYGVCVARLEAAASASTLKASPGEGAELLSKCRQLYRAIRSQAAMLLVQVQWFIGVAGDLGVTASDAEVLAYYNRAIHAQFPNRAELIRDQAAKHISTSDELLLIKKNLLSQKVLEKLKKQGKAGSRRLLQSEAAWTAKTDCRTGYVVEHCKQFHGEAPPTPESPSAAVLIERVAALLTGRCTNLAACGRE